MSMEIKSSYSGYAAGYANGASKVGNANHCEKDEKGIIADTVNMKTPSKRGNTVTNSALSPKSAGMNYLKDMQKKCDGTAFAVGTVNRGQTYGNSSDINFVIHPGFVSKLGSDAGKQKQFEEDVEYLTNFTKKFKEQQATKGWNVENCGWFCDKAGNWGGWCVLKKIDDKSFLQKMQEQSDKIKEEKNAKKLEQKKPEDDRIYLDDADMKIIMDAAKEDSMEKLSVRERVKIGVNIDLQV